MVYAYNASNIGGHTKKVTVNAITLFTFSIGNVVGTQIFPSGDAPKYVPGKIAIMVLFTAQIFLSLLLRWTNIRANREKLDKLSTLAEQNEWDETRIQKERERHAFADLTDKEYAHDLNLGVLWLTSSFIEIPSLSTHHELFV